MKLNEKMKKIIAIVGAVVIVVVGAVWFLDSDLEHIEDTFDALKKALLSG